MLWNTGLGSFAHCLRSCPLILSGPRHFLPECEEISHNCYKSSLEHWQILCVNEYPLKYPELWSLHSGFLQCFFSFAIPSQVQVIADILFSKACLWACLAFRISPFSSLVAACSSDASFFKLWTKLPRLLEDIPFSALETAPQAEHCFLIPVLNVHDLDFFPPDNSFIDVHSYDVSIPEMGIWGI